MKGVGYLQDLLTSIFERSGSAEHGPLDTRSIGDISQALLSERGEVSGHLLAGAALDRFDSLDEAGKLAFFEMLNNDYDLNTRDLAAAAKAYESDASLDNFSHLLHTAEPRRQELLRRLNSAPGATARLVKMREWLLSLLRDRPEFGRTDMDMRHLFASWFNRGFLVMRHIDWQSPASLLEKIIAYEAVHAIDDWDDLRRRMQPPDRRCFAFFHPAMPDEPLIFVEVALVDEAPESIQDVLANDRVPIDPANAKTAVFYSISNCQKGLKGVSFGNFLIKQVAGDLAEEMPHLKNFITLSPVPGLMRWVDQVTERPEAHSAYVEAESLAAIQAVRGGNEAEPDGAQAKAVLSQVAAYFCEAKRSDGFPVDPVARFHLGNGASLDRIILGADRSAKGLAQSASVMVNYRYELSEIENRHQAYVSQGQVHTSKRVAALLPGTKRSRGRRAADEQGPDHTAEAS